MAIGERVRGGWPGGVAPSAAGNKEPLEHSARFARPIISTIKYKY